MLKKMSLIVLCVILILAAYELIRRKVGGFGGSYPFAESWEVKRTIEDIEYNLNKLHEKNPNIFFNNDYLFVEKDPTSYWRRVDFFYEERNERVKVLFREFDKHSLILLVSFTNIYTGEVKLMNKDFNWFENRKEKEIFESRILKWL